MKKRILLIMVITSLFLLTACRGEIQKNEKHNNEEEKNPVVVENFIGEGRYIIANQVYDYSGLIENVFEWESGIKLPIDKPKDSKASVEVGGRIRIVGFELEDIEVYKSDLKKQGFTIYDSDNGVFEKNDFDVYKDGLCIMFQYNEADSIEYYDVWVYMGNVIAERKVNISAARKLIDDSQVLANNIEYEEYYVFPIETESVSAEGFFEFLIVSPNKSTDAIKDTQPYYMITDGKKINLCEQKLLSTSYPTNAVIVTSAESEKELVVVGMNHSLLYGNTSAYHITSYKLVEDDFVKNWEKDRPNISPEFCMMVKYVNEEVKYFVLKCDEEAALKYGRKDMWKIDNEIILE